MSSLPDSAPLAGPAVPPPIPTISAKTSRPPRTWYFIGSTLFAAGVYAVLMILNSRPSGSCSSATGSS
jgi:hypothetical protein